jgi:uncharacterized protein (UPF0332 family)
MTTERLSEYARTRLRLAEEMLADARLLLGDGRLKSAADRAYYSMFHSAQAALAAQGIAAPRSHRGLRSQFGKHLVVTGIIEREYARDLTLAHEMRQEGTYEAYAAMSVDSVAELVARAQKLLERVNLLVRKEGK